MTTLLVANTGGHLTQLHSLLRRLPVEDRVWVTLDGPQSRSLLAGEKAVYLTYPRARNVFHVARNTALALRRLPQRGVDQVITTGASLALSVLPPYALRGIPCHYIESATRVDGPSSSGRLLSRVPGIRLYTQHETWADARWRYSGTVLDGYRATPTGSRPVRKVVVTLGSSEGYPFRRPLERLLEILPEGVEVLWQTGSTPVDGLPLTATPSMSSEALNAAIRDADVVVAHAGTGSTLTALANGKMPLLLPRLISRGEHVDDHQTQIAAMLEERGLAVVRDAGTVEWSDLEHAAAHEVSLSATTPFALRN
ncbi:glycosyltransferase [Kineococcus gynurae]|uniref:Glycosyltransferase n=1 Tax=Kineococcus gynurae TaxID=452979 RepID=A0ABV5LNV4_9ACTN